jgi:hypothetical protein
MKKWITILITLALAGTFTALAADTKQSGAAADMDKRIAALNKLDNEPSALQAGLRAVSRETAVPLRTIEADHTKHKIGVAGLFMAHELAAKTHKPAATFLKQANEGQSWKELAAANNLNLTDVDQKLARIETAMRNPTASATTPGTERTPVRERDSRKSELDTRIASLNTLDDQPLAMRTGLAAVSKETAVPLTQIEDLQKQNANAGVGDLFVAQELATHTQKPASDFLKQHSDGKSWSQLISDNNQNRTEIEQKLARVEDAMKNAK